MTELDLADDLLAYIEASPTPWHAVQETRRRLEEAGYRRLDERDRWSLSACDKVYVIRGGSSIAAFEIGTAAPSEAGFRFVGAHTDSPNLRLKPRPQRLREHIHQLSVEPYGGVLLHTWLDRDLSIAGRLLTKGDAGLEEVLVRFDAPLARISSLAIHLHRDVNEEGLKLNAQDHMLPMFAFGGHAPELEAMLAERAGVAPEAIAGWDLCLYDVVPPSRGGPHGEMILAPRLDNLASCHAGLSALLSAGDATAATRGVVLYDHEECGSMSPQGADSPFLSDLLERLARAFDDASDAYPRALARSFLVSADMAHAVHPNYADKHEPEHKPRLGAGPVIKTNVNQRYATDGESAARFRRWCAEADVVPQEFVTRSDLRCGSTIGPISAGRLGVRALDVGNPMLSMHSCREMSAAADVAPMIAALRVFLSRLD
ncbi:MAG: M18 family aminopeptidase [Myxococcota bacterium]|nr:M18 family aminopeptidase [Myxococcota bacterium]